MLGRIFTRCVRRQLLVVPLLLAALPLAAPTLAAELVVDNAEGRVTFNDVTFSYYDQDLPGAALLLCGTAGFRRRWAEPD